MRICKVHLIRQLGIMASETRIRVHLVDRVDMLDESEVSFRQDVLFHFRTIVEPATPNHSS